MRSDTDTPFRSSTLSSALAWVRAALPDLAVRRHSQQRLEGGLRLIARVTTCDQCQAGDPAAADTLQRAVDGAQLAGNRRLLTPAQVSQVAQAEVLRSAGDRPAAHTLLEAAHRWYAESGAGEGAALAACLRATMRTEDGEPGAEQDPRSIRDAAESVGDREVQALASAALVGVTNV